MSATTWVRVTAKSPCPVCKHGDWCSLSADGALAKCMRVAEGAWRSKTDKNGAPYHLHRLADGPRPAADVPPPPGPEAERADPDTLHDAYSAALSRMQLSKAHREALRCRGLADGAIDRGGYRTLYVPGRSRIARELLERFGDKLLRVPGFAVKDGKDGRYPTLLGSAGLLVPCRDRAGRVAALKVRRDDPGDGPRYLYVSSAKHGGPSPGAPVHCPAGTPATAELVRLTEGELKADVIQALTGLPAISVPGVGTWRPALDVLRELSCKTVRLAFDADAWDKPPVARALAGCADALAAAGFAVELERWAAADGKGLDDLLAAGKAPELLTGDKALSAVREILAAATADEGPAPPDALALLQDVLNADGPAGVYDKKLLQALAALSVDDPPAYARARQLAQESGVKMRGFDHAIKPLIVEEIKKRPAPLARGETGGFFEDAGCICRTKLTPYGPQTVQLCNFTARIVDETTRDDGAERECRLGITGTLATGRPLLRVEVPAEQYTGLGWVVPSWGSDAIVWPGEARALPAAIQALSQEAKARRTVYAHTGWRRIGEAWHYLHAGGAIGPNGLAADVPVSLPDPLAGYQLPAPPDGADLADAVRASLALLTLGPSRLTFPLLAAAYRAVLGDCDFALHLAGPTGAFKSEAAALAQQHYGPGMDARHLPANWSSTGNALEGLAFAAKDALLVVDDFCPTGSAADVQRYHKEADRLFRGQGNRAGRQRMRADATLRPAKPPRGLTLSTGEDTPRGQSLRARLLVLDTGPGDFGPQPPALNPTLTACQRAAADGHYAAALAGFLRWLAPQMDAIRGRLRAELAELREKAKGDGQHARTPGIVADLALGLHYCLEFALAAGAVSEAERAELWGRGWAALAEAGAAQAAHIATAEPAALFLRLLSAAVASGFAHVADERGNEPREPLRWGWRPEEYGAGENAAMRYKAQGVRVGWLADGELYLEPEASFAAVQRFAREQNEAFSITANTLRRRLKEKGLLATADTARGKLTVRKTLQGARRDVLHIAWAGAPSAPQADPAGQEGGAAGADGPETWADPRAESGQANGEAAPDTAPAGTPGQPPALSAPEVGRLVRLDAGEGGAAAPPKPWGLRAKAVGSRRQAKEGATAKASAELTDGFSEWQ